MTGCLPERLMGAAGMKIRRVGIQLGATSVACSVPDQGGGGNVPFEKRQQIEQLLGSPLQVEVVEVVSDV